MWLEDLFDPSSPEAKARVLWLFYLISLFMMLLGFVFIFLFWNN